MELVERYLAAIAGQLPKSQRDDVVAELRDEILSRIEEREAVLGRPLGTGETEDLLREVGHPLVVASRFWPVQQLIGPETFPVYLWFLRTALLIVVGVQVVLLCIGMATAPGYMKAAAGLPGGLISSLVGAFAWVTLVFAGLEYFGVSKTLMRKWKPSELPAVGARKRKGRFDLVFEAAASVVFILWWTHVIHFGNFMPLRGGSEIRISMSAAWAPFWWPILGMMALQLAANLAELARPAWSRFNAGAMLASHVLTAVIGVLLIQAGPLVDVTGPADAPGVASIADGVNLGLRIGFAFAAGISALQAVGDLRRVVQGGPRLRGFACI